MAENSHIATGAIHVHTTDSDGTKTHEEVAAIASEVGLDFVMFADHMTLQSFHDGKEGYYNDLLVLIGYEHNDNDDCNHYLIFDGDEVFPSSMTAAEYVAAAASKGTLGILAHPDEIRGRDARFRSYPWTDWSVTQFDGIELWNQMSEWMENLKFFNQIRMLFSPRKFLRAPTDRIRRKWDELSLKRKIVGIASVDAHGFLYRAGPLKLTIFPYKVQFKTLRTHVMLDRPLSKDLSEAKQQIYSAIRDCRVFISNYRWGEARDFKFTITSQNGSADIGGSLPFTGSATAKITVPLKGKIRLIGNSKVIKEAKARELEYLIKSPGIYRVEVYHGRKGWIFSNHIRLNAPGE
ncbi:MAG: PHP domain-containing protein [candidate division Zixibacteria bacterium]|nr:PHP domain-containing protein [candidate division Zixibacteria bacterium]